MECAGQAGRGREPRGAHSVAPPVWPYEEVQAWTSGSGQDPRQRLADSRQALEDPGFRCLCSEEAGVWVFFLPSSSLEFNFFEGQRAGREGGREKKAAGHKCHPPCAAAGLPSTGPGEGKVGA